MANNLLNELSVAYSPVVKSFKEGNQLFVKTLRMC